MVKHYNNSISEDAARILNSKQGQFLGDDVQGPVAVIPIVPFCNIVKHAIRATTGSTGVYTTPSDKDFYLTGLQLSATADASCDCTEFWVNAVGMDGVSSVRFAALRRTTLTAFNQSIYIPFPIPIKLGRNTGITSNQTFTVGTATIHLTVYGYTVETTK